MSGQSPRQTIIIIKNASEQELWVGGREQKILQTKMSYCCLSRVRTKDSDQIWPAGITIVKFVLIGWFSGFSREVILRSVIGCFWQSS